MRKLVYWVFLFSNIIWAQTPLNSEEAAKFKAKVKTKATQTTTISSNFTQYKHLDFLSNDIITKGQLTFKSPNMVKWEYTDPFSYYVIFKGETLYINDDGKKNEVNIGSSKMFKQLNQLIVKSVKGDMFDDSMFNISYFKEKKQIQVHFIFKNEQYLEYLKAFHITFSEEGDVEEVKMIEQSDDFTKIVFKNRQLNKPIPDAFFAN
ncbi:LolA family protein [Seonamhaeicola marinus]|uniref:Outer membrane lipoprotein carrier protein LolA n=1 Tax=Seonamhaeicola marinus TaxID=1912246 RepID=A0A5D0HU22_9FLAO|nr:outer membrane lipoprotein carrier protein LolA [Seonamhaeicola marinus]TYA73959.1 outer membrane lipoprotein carrier protein LolA [Seonamhaeicola marinus]